MNELLISSHAERRVGTHGHASLLRDSRVTMTSRLGKISVFSALLLMFCSGALATEVLDNFKMARSYLDADLVIIGDVLSCSTEVAEEKDVLGSDGWVQHFTKLVSTYAVRVDSVLKGSLRDTLIIIQNESGKSYALRTTFFKLDEKGDSLFLGETTAPMNDVGWNSIPELAKYVLLLKKKDGKYTSILCHSPDEYSLDLYRQVKEQGEDYFKPPEPQRK